MLKYLARPSTSTYSALERADRVAEVSAPAPTLVAIARGATEPAALSVDIDPTAPSGGLPVSFARALARCVRPTLISQGTALTLVLPYQDRIVSNLTSMEALLTFLHSNEEGRKEQIATLLSDEVDRIDFQFSARLSAVIWSLALREDNVEESRARDDGRLWKISRWPHLELWERNTESVRLAALFARAPTTIRVASAMLKIPCERVSAFLHACQICDVEVVNVEREQSCASAPTTQSLRVRGTEVARLRTWLLTPGSAPAEISRADRLEDVSGLKVLFLGQSHRDKATAVKAMTNLPVESGKVSRMAEYASFFARDSAKFLFSTLDIGYRVPACFVTMPAEPGLGRTLDRVWQGDVLGAVLLVSSNTTSSLNEIAGFLDEYADLANLGALAIGVTDLESQRAAQILLYQNAANRAGRCLPVFAVDVAKRQDIHLLIEALIANAEVSASAAAQFGE